MLSYHFHKGASIPIQLKRGAIMNELKVLKKMIIELIKKENDTDLLDLIWKQLLIQKRGKKFLDA